MDGAAATDEERAPYEEASGDRVRDKQALKRRAARCDGEVIHKARWYLRREPEQVKRALITGVIQTVRETAVGGGDSPRS